MKKHMKLFINHPSWDAPVVHEHVLDSPSMSKIMRNLNLTSVQLCQLKAKGQTSWQDARGVTHTLVMSDVQAPTPQPTQPAQSTHRKLLELKDDNACLLLQMTPQEKPQLRIKAPS